MLTQSSKIKFGWKAEDFNLKSTKGSYLSLEDIKLKNGIIIAFICNHCPYVKDIIKRLVNDFTYLKTLNVGCVTIMPNDVDKYPEDSYENMKKFALEHKFTFPYLIDVEQETAKLYEAKCTPDFFCFDRNNLLFYRGRLDNLAYKKNNNERKTELLNAVRGYIDNKRNTEKQFSSIGCSIKWK